MQMEIFIQIFQVIGPIIVAVVFIVMIKSDVRILGVRMDSMNDNLKILNNSFDKLGTILTAVAVQGTEINSIREDIRELKHGKGFVNIDGEYRGSGKVG